MKALGWWSRPSDPPWTIGRPAELPAPDNQRVVEHPSLLQILDQGRAGLVGVGTVLLKVAHEVAVLVPGLVKDLDEADPALQEAAGQQAGAGKRGLARLRAVQVEDVLRLAADVHHLGRGHLHPEGHLVGVDSGGDLRVAHPLEAKLIERADSSSESLLDLPVDAPGFDR